MKNPEVSEHAQEQTHTMLLQAAATARLTLRHKWCSSPV